MNPALSLFQAMSSDLVVPMADRTLWWKIDHGKQPLVHLGCAFYSVAVGFVAKFWEYFVEAAWKLREAVTNHTDQVVRDWVDTWLQSPIVYQLTKPFNKNNVMMGSSPRFNMYGNEFGMGKAVAFRSGYADKFDGNVSSYPGYEGGGSIDLEVCLLPDSMSALEFDEEFMDAVSLPHQLH
nr:bahd acyltransferase dcr [Quercus suber]